ncbi:hypothetical protein KQX54_003613 [Cotesia glomerata]|uniref:Uncharacterized protein n=1 Tax=Cotesia glomerata TaxID=32391 RepID=A0AAV7IMW0_COTGL|nr:hypothetical protein KQX54_003613 [Cotesia glomerata]
MRFGEPIQLLLLPADISTLSSIRLSPLELGYHSGTSSASYFNQNSLHAKRKFYAFVGSRGSNHTLFLSKCLSRILCKGSEQMRSDANRGLISAVPGKQTRQATPCA